MFNQTTQTILQQLANGGFHSGQQLGEQLGVSRAAIGKHIQALQELGLTIYSVTGKGYRLNQPITLLEQQRIVENMSPEHHDQVSVATVVSSTNELIKQKIQANDLIDGPSGYTLFAEAQTAGRGRRGRDWVSPLGSSLYFSTHWRFDQGINATMGLSLAVGIAICEALTELGVVDLGLKWPNDVYLNGKKLAGILIELESQGVDSCDLVIGVGVNIDLPQHINEQIEQPFTDLSDTNIDLDRNVLASALLSKLWQVVNEFEQQGFSVMIDRWNRFDCFVGQPVELIVGQRRIGGLAQGVDSQGGFILSSDGQSQTYFGGEISLRAVNKQQGKL